MSDEEVAEFKIKQLKRASNDSRVGEDLRNEWGKKYQQALKEKVEVQSKKFDQMIAEQKDKFPGE